MPWKEDGTFERENGPDPVFKGDDVWQDDQKASIKVVAARHDYHDEGLANGIEGCLNLDGYNSMRADLDMGGFQVINTLEEEDVSDGIFTPQLPTGFVTGGTHGGSWVRVGNYVTVMAYIQWTTKGAATGLLLISNMPFSIGSPKSGNDRQFMGNVMGWDNLDLAGRLPDGSVETFTRAFVKNDSNSLKLSNYLGHNNFGYRLMSPDVADTPTEGAVLTKLSAYDGLQTRAPEDFGFANLTFDVPVSDLLETGSFAFNYSYFTTDPAP